LGADILKLYTSYRGDRFQVPTRQTGEYKVDVTRHPKFPVVSHTAFEKATNN
jgi:hypothetical protein